MTTANYRHSQLGWVILVTSALVTALGGWIVMIDLTVAGVLCCALGAIISLCFGWLTVTVTADTFHFKMGIGLVQKSIPLQELRFWSSVQNAWLWGWGIRLYPGGWLYNVSGLGAVELHLNSGKQLRIGTDQSDALCAAITNIKGEAVPLTEQEQAQTQRRKKNFGVAIVVGLAAVFSLIGVLFWAQMQPVVVTVNTTGFSVDEALYDVTVPWSEVTDIELVSDLPKGELRTNGFALAGVLRGHFRIEELGDGRLYINRNTPPFILVKTASDDGDFVAINYEDAADTEALFREMSSVR